MKIICFGDSNTFGYDPSARCGEPYSTRWTDLLGEKTGWEIINQGVNGREVPNEAVLIPDDIDMFLVMLGTNDLLQLDTPEAAAERMEVFLSECVAEKLVVISPPTMVRGLWVQDEELIEDSVRLAVLYQDLCSRLGIRFLNAAEWNDPLCYDGVHITQEGQAVFADGLFNALVKGE